VVTPIHEDFTAETNLSTPFLMLQDKTTAQIRPPIPNILFVTTNDFMWLKWNLPDSGWTPQIRSDFESAVWTDSPFTNTVVFGTTRYTQDSHRLCEQQYSELLPAGQVNILTAE